MAFDAEGQIEAAQIDFISDCGAYPDALAGRHGGGGRCHVPWPVSRSYAPASRPRPSTPTPWAGRRIEAPGSSSPWPARSSSTSRPGRWQIDPAELRRRNLLRVDEFPYTSPNGTPLDRIAPLATFEQALAMLDYDAFRQAQKEARPAGRYLGVGFSTYVEPSTPGFGYYATEGATIRVEPSGRVNVYIAGGSTGNSIETTVVQLAADALGCNIEDVATIQGDTAVTGFGAGAAGSRSGSMTAGAVGQTASILRDRIVAIAAHRLEASADDLELADSRVSVRGTPTVGMSLAEVAALAYFDAYSLPPGIPAGLEASSRYTTAQGSIFVNATHLCTCEVDVSTGEVKLLRYIVSEDCGPMINPNVVEGQIAGGVRARDWWGAVRAPGLRRRWKPSRHHLHGLSAADGGRSADDRVRPRGDAELGPRRLQGRRRRGRDRRTAGSRQRGRRCPGTLRRDGHALALDAIRDRAVARQSPVVTGHVGDILTAPISPAASHRRLVGDFT